MAASMSTEIKDAAAVVEEETCPLLGVGSPEPGAWLRTAARIRPAPPPRRTFWRACCEWLQQLALALRKDPLDGIPVNKPLDANQLKRARELTLRQTWLEHLDLLAIKRHLAMECLSYYNSMHPCDEYELAPGLVFKYINWGRFDVAQDNFVAHGNFVARRKRSGCFSLLPAPRTLFFFELLLKNGFEYILTCTPLLDEPVTEAYSVLGYPIWWGKRRDGRYDCFCKTCHRRFKFVGDDLPSRLACGHDNKAERVCRICYPRSDVLHPFPNNLRIPPVSTPFLTTATDANC
ncbi:hypothetical protein ACP4OV_022483 [Aristida adscensionis]